MNSGPSPFRKNTPLEGMGFLDGMLILVGEGIIVGLLIYLIIPRLEARWNRQDEEFFQQSEEKDARG